MPSDALYQALAEALAKPNKNYQALQSAFEIPSAAMKGYEEGAKFSDAIQKRKQANMTLSEMLKASGAEMPAGTEGYGNLTYSQFEPTAKLLSGLGAIEKTKKTKEEYIPRSMDAILAENVRTGKMTEDQAYKIKNRGLLLRGGYEEGGDGTLNPVPGGKPFSDLESIKTARTSVSDKLSTLRKHYEDLKKTGSIVDVSKSGISNIGPTISSSGPGQVVGKVFGTEAQSVRNKINQIRPLLINDIRKASNMGAKGLDSENELKFYLQAATDPSLDIQANLSAIDTLDKAYGLGISDGETGDLEADAAIRIIKNSSLSDNEKTARISGIKASVGKK